jgi:hypothetical protein
VTQVEGSAWLSRVQRLRELVVTRAIFESNFWEQFLGAILLEQFLGTIFMDIFVVVVDFLISIVLFLMALHGRQFDPD